MSQWSRKILKDSKNSFLFFFQVEREYTRVDRVKQNKGGKKENERKQWKKINF